jgi:hypothetical protein
MAETGAGIRVGSAQYLERIVPVINYYNPVWTQIPRTPAQKRTPPKARKVVRKAATKRKAKASGCGFWGLGCVAHGLRKAASVVGNATGVTNLVNCVSHPTWGRCLEAAAKIGGDVAAGASEGLEIAGEEAAEAAAGAAARFAVDSSGETTMYLRAGEDSLEVTEHAALRMTQRGISIDRAEATLSREPFQYYYKEAWQTGYYDQDSRVFIGSAANRITTVMKAGQNYINNLTAASP